MEHAHIIVQPCCIQDAQFIRGNPQQNTRTRILNVAQSCDLASNPISLLHLHMHIKMGRIPEVETTLHMCIKQTRSLMLVRLSR